MKKSRHKYLILLAVGMGTFMTALDASVINTVLPVINIYFKSNITSIQWIVVIYLLVVSGLLLTFGRLGDLHGHKLVYLIGFFLFILSSICCGLSQSTIMLICFRGLQALGASMLMANSPAILTGNFPPNQRGQALGMQGTMTSLGLTVGPSLGGWLTQQFGWQTVFFINVPVGILAFVLSFILINKDTQQTKIERFDIPGAIIFTSGLVVLLLGLNRGSEWGWTSPIILGLLALAIFLLYFFITLERRQTFPMLDLTLFTKRVFSASTASAVINYICLYSITFLLPFYLLQGRNFSPALTGLLLTAQPLSMAIVAPISGTISDRIGSRIPSTLGMIILAAGLFMLSRFNAGTTQTYIILSLATVGLGTGIFNSPNTSALLGSAPSNRQGIASGVLATARNMGMVIGVGLAGAILTSILKHPSSNALFTAVNIGFLTAMSLALIGSLISVIRGNEVNGKTHRT